MRRSLGIVVHRVVAAIAVAAAIVALEGCVDTVPLPSSSPSAAVKTTFGRDTVGVQTENPTAGWNLPACAGVHRQWGDGLVDGRRKGGCDP